jgi:hypothetical protein
LGEFVVLEFEAVSHIGAEGEQSDGDLGYDTGGVIFDEGVIATDIDDGTVHIRSSFRYNGRKTA